ncbi:hypothetical protein B0H67DRAFT_23519 [Lasiosphaeris hirsuta]|uniref:Uncharacterized protein n=1 Tax=Lasiosphaeris hirsuta TaxID=260670 RepID=A0AA40B9E9_9PEZI|nr:hypothetical protein B0H67DRAFT_23519 [Lasiosphaeris hirsuta]
MGMYGVSCGRSRGGRYVVLGVVRHCRLLQHTRATTKARNIPPLPPRLRPFGPRPDAGSWMSIHGPCCEEQQRAWRCASPSTMRLPPTAPRHLSRPAAQLLAQSEPRNSPSLRNSSLQTCTY